MFDDIIGKLESEKISNKKKLIQKEPAVEVVTIQQPQIVEDIKSDKNIPLVSEIKKTTNFKDKLKRLQNASDQVKKTNISETKKINRNIIELW